MLWAEALDGGDLKNKVPFRDKVMALAAPFTGQPVEIAKTEWRYGGINYTDTGIALLTENDRATRRTRTLDPRAGRGAAEGLGSQAGRRLRRSGHRRSRGATTGATAGGGGGGRGGAGGGSIIQNGDFIYVAGVGASKDGDRPFLDKLNVKTLKTERIFRSSAESLESFVAPLNDEMTKFLTRYETQKDAPNYYTRDAGADAKRAVTTVQGSAAAGARHPPAIRHLQAQRRRHAVRHAVPAAGLQAGHAGAGDHVGLSARVRRRRLGQPGLGIAELVHDDPRRLAHVPADVRLRDLRQPDDADHRAGRNRQRHLRRAAGRERAGGDRQGGRDGRRRSRSHRRRRPQLRRLHDREPAGALAAVPRRLRRERRLQPLADAVGLPDGAALVLGGAGHLHQDVAVLVRRQDQGSDPADARRDGRQHRARSRSTPSVSTWRSRATARRCAW